MIGFNKYCNPANWVSQSTIAYQTARSFLLQFFTSPGAAFFGVEVLEGFMAIAGRRVSDVQCGIFPPRIAELVAAAGERLDLRRLATLERVLDLGPVGMLWDCDEHSNS